MIYSSQFYLHVLSSAQIFWNSLYATQISHLNVACSLTRNAMQDTSKIFREQRRLRRIWDLFSHKSPWVIAGGVLELTGSSKLLVTMIHSVEGWVEPQPILTATNILISILNILEFARCTYVIRFKYTCIVILIRIVIFQIENSCMSYTLSAVPHLYTSKKRKWDLIGESTHASQTNVWRQQQGDH